MPEDKKVPINTRGMVVKGSDAIVAQEAEGLRSLVNSDTLPTDINERDKKVLEAAGVKFGEPVPGDKLFQYAELPAGWKKVVTEDARASHLVDDRGRVRAVMFYKAAFYDRKADLHATTRFSFRFDYDRRSDQGDCVSHVSDCGRVIFTTEPFPFEDLESYEASQKANHMAENWLIANYPDWENPGAYWD